MLTRRRDKREKQSDRVCTSCPIHICALLEPIRASEKSFTCCTLIMVTVSARALQAQVWCNKKRTRAVWTRRKLGPSTSWHVGMVAQVGLLFVKAGNAGDSHDRHDSRD